MDGCTAGLIELHPATVEIGPDDAGDTVTLPQLQRLSLRARRILHLQMQGLPRTEIAIRTGLTGERISIITHSPDYVAARDALLDREEAALRAMKPMAWTTVSRRLTTGPLR
jgi:hypothetical protein